MDTEGLTIAEAFELVRQEADLQEDRSRRGSLSSIACSVDADVQADVLEEENQLFRAVVDPLRGTETVFDPSQPFRAEEWADAYTHAQTVGDQETVEHLVDYMEASSGERHLGRDERSDAIFDDPEIAAGRRNRAIASGLAIAGALFLAPTTAGGLLTAAGVGLAGAGLAGGAASVVPTGTDQGFLGLYGTGEEGFGEFTGDDLAREGFYQGSSFHRVVRGFMVQGGCPRGDGPGGPGYHIQDEEVKRPYVRGTLAMASAGHDKNGSQFFIVHGKRVGLSPNYTIFGKLLEGDDTLELLGNADVQVGTGGDLSRPTSRLEIHGVEIEEQKLG